MLLFIFFMVSRRPIIAAVMLACAVGVKLWPVVLVFFLASANQTSRRTRAIAVCLFLVLLTVLMFFFAPAVTGTESGTLAYLQTWRANHGAFRLFEYLGSFDRMAMMMCLFAFAAYQAFSRGDLCQRTTMVVLVMILLSPTIYPWYYVALIGLAALSLRWEFLILTALLPLLYLPIAPNIAAAAIHLPVWALLAIRCWKGEVKA